MLRWCTRGPHSHSRSYKVSMLFRSGEGTCMLFPGLKALRAPEYGWQVGAVDAKRGPGEHGEGDAVLRAGVGIEHHGD